MTERTREQLDNIRKWTNALTSGEYEQGRDHLISEENTFCCLGVACALGLATPDEHNHYPLSGTMLDTMGFSGHDVKVGGKFVSTLNDDGNTFTEIARAIKEEYL